VARSLWALGASDIGRGVLEAVRRHAGDALTDDATVVVVKFR
jgi:hypothetical protein